jgi:hypothetical protein
MLTKLVPGHSAAPGPLIAGTDEQEQQKTRLYHINAATDFGYRQLPPGNLIVPQHAVARLNTFSITFCERPAIKYRADAHDDDKRRPVSLHGGHIRRPAVLPAELLARTIRKMAGAAHSRSRPRWKLRQDRAFDPLDSKEILA